MYLTLLYAHLSLALLSAGVFIVRGALVLGGQGARANLAAVRYLSYAIDTLLLSAAVGLLVQLRGAPLHALWLQMKLVLLPIYIVLGALALRRARQHWQRVGCYVAALCALAAMFALALGR